MRLLHFKNNISPAIQQQAYSRRAYNVVLRIHSGSLDYDLGQPIFIFEPIHLTSGTPCNTGVDFIPTGPKKMNVLSTSLLFSMMHSSFFLSVSKQNSYIFNYSCFSLSVVFL